MLEEYTGCTCVPTNTTKQMPAYPLIGFNVINTGTSKGTYSATTIEENGITKDIFYMPLLQKWSFTAQSDNEAEAQEKAMLISDFFAVAKRLELADNNIIVADVGAITPRDNLLTIEYEYRRGLDVTLRFTNIIDDPTTEVIEKATLTSDEGEHTIEKE